MMELISGGTYELAKFVLDDAVPEGGMGIFLGSKGGGKTSLCNTISYALLKERERLIAEGYGSIYIITNNTYSKKLINGWRDEWPKYMYFAKDFPQLFVTVANIIKEEMKETDKKPIIYIIMDEAHNFVNSLRTHSKREFSFSRFLDVARHAYCRIFLSLPKEGRMLTDLREEIYDIDYIVEDGACPIDEFDEPTYITSVWRKKRGRGRIDACRAHCNDKDIVYVRMLNYRGSWVSGSEMTFAIEAMGGASPDTAQNGDYKVQSHSFESFRPGYVDGQEFDILEFMDEIGGVGEFNIADKMLDYFGGGEKDNIITDRDMLIMLFARGFAPRMKGITLAEHFNMSEKQIYNIYNDYKEGVLL